MYNLPELALHTRKFANALASAIAREIGINGELLIEPGHDVAMLWHRDQCLFSQSCGYPLTHDYRTHLQAIAVPDYDTGDDEPGLYRSLFIVHSESTHRTLADLRGGVAAVNGWDSQSGFNALRHALLPLADGGPFFRETVISGGHRNSIRLVADGKCDIAAIDRVSFALIRNCSPEEVENIRVIGKSAAAPSLPFVTSIHSSSGIRAGLLRALTSVFERPDLAEARNNMLLRSFSAAEENSYACIKTMADEGADFDFTKT